VKGIAACYAVSADGATLTVWAVATAHDGYPASEPRLIFDRGTVLT
jgi:hypothetical protein